MSGCCSIFFAAARNKEFTAMSFVFERREERCCNILQSPQHPANFLVSCCGPVNGQCFLQDVEEMKKRAKIRNLRPHDSVLWARLCFIIRVETGWDNDPIPFKKLQKLCPSVSLEDLDSTLREMAYAKRIRITREWDEAGRMLEVITNNE